MFVCLFIRLFVYSLGFFLLLWGFLLLFSSGNGGFLFTVTTTVFSILYSVSSRLSNSFIASVVTLVLDISVSVFSWHSISVRAYVVILYFNFLFWILFYLAPFLA